MLTAYANKTLTLRQKEILELMALGKTNKELSELLFLAESTVRRHMVSARVKMDCSTTRELLMKVMR